MNTSKTSLSPTILSKLHLLRRLLRSRLLVEGLARLTLAAAGAVVVSLALDYALHLDRPLRAAVLAVAAAVILYTFWRRIAKPTLAPMPLSHLALLIEKKFPQLGDRLITALELTDETAISPAMLAQTAQQAEQITRTLPMKRIVETRRLRRTVGLATVLLVLIVGFAFAQPAVMKLWLQRNVLLAEVDWPQRTYLCVYYVDQAGTLRPLLESDSDGTIRVRRETAEVLRGEALEVLVASAAGTTTPDTVTLHVRYPSVGDTEEKLSPLPREQVTAFLDATQPNRTWYRKRFASVNEAISFHAVGGDDRRDARQPHRVALAEAPCLSDVQFTIVAPAYMRQAQPAVLPGSRGVLPIPRGSAVHISALASKPIAQARMKLDDKDAAAMNVDTKSADAPGRRLTGVLKPSGGNAAATRTLTFELKDDAGYSNSRPETFILQILPDLPPSVEVKSRGVRNVVCPSARIPLSADAKDDHGLAEVRVVWRTAEPETDTQPAASPVWQVVEKAIAISPDDPRRQTSERVLDLLPISPAPGAKLLVRAEAVDTLPASLDGPNTAGSAELSFEIIPREKLLAQLIGMQKEARMELFQAMGQQSFAQGRCTSAADDLAGGEIRPNVLSRLADAAARQRQVMNESTKVADSMAAVATEMEFNRLGKAEEHADLRNNVVAPLRKLTGQMRSVAADLDAARDAKDAATLAGDARAVAAKQQDIYAAMESILANMRKLEDRLELARHLEGLLKMSVELDAILRQRVERGIEDVFENEEDGDQ